MASVRPTEFYSRRKRLLRRAAPYLLIASVAFVYHKLYFFYTTPQTVRAFYRHHALLDKVVRLQEGKSIDAGVGELEKSLGGASFTSVRRDGKCIVFHYAVFMDAIDIDHEIIYSPNGYHELPNYRTNEFNRLYELRQVKDRQWFYVCHD
jgi:hypothetical protein